MQGKGKSRGIRSAIAGVAVLGAALLAAVSASAYEITPYTPSSSFDGSATSEGAFGSTVRSIDVDQQTGAVYVLTNQPGIVLHKFDASGTPAAFSDPSLGGATSLNMGANIPGNLRVAVDNSSNPTTRGRIYVYDSIAQKLWAFNASGSAVGGAYPVASESTRDIAVDPSSGNLWIELARNSSDRVSEFLPDGVTATDNSFRLPYSGASEIAVDSTGDPYVLSNGEGLVRRFDPDGSLVHTLPAPGATDLSIDPETSELWAHNPTALSQFDPNGSKLAEYAAPVGGFGGIAINGASGDLYVGSRTVGDDPADNRVDILTPGAAIEVPGVITGAASDFNPAEVTLHGTVNPDGVATDDCRFEWSTDTSFGNSVPCAEGTVLTGSGDQQVSAVLTGLTQGTQYNYRLVASNANGEVTGRQDQTFRPSSPPSVGGEQFATGTRGDGFIAHADINPGGAATTFHVELGPEDCSANPCSPATGSGSVAAGLNDTTQSLNVSGLSPGTTYHYRMVATNQSGTSYGVDRVLSTFPQSAVLQDPCANAHVRQQTGAALLPDCRAYELVSASNLGGYNVESSLVAGQTPFAGYPEAGSNVLYGIHNGGIPGIEGHPTNRGVDPYLAERGEGGWSTSYIGLSADNPFATGPFSSTLAQASPGLDAFAFGGGDICDPCFADGSTGMPVRTTDGNLIQGFGGSLSDPSATPAGIVRKHFSADGEHFLFGTTAQLEPEANSNGTDATIYERDLITDTTQVVSTLPSGAAITNGEGVAALDVSADGSRVVIGELVSTDTAGNDYYHLYMHIGTNPASIDLMPGSTQGALYGGMSADGSMVYFTTKDALTTSENQDTDSSTDLYRADVDGSAAELTRVSYEPNAATGGVGDADSCNPIGNTVNANWNAVEGAGIDCSAVAVGGGGGVASDSGAAYFLSPELLDTSGAEQPTQNEPNLYLTRPGDNPRFIATLESQSTGPDPLPTEHAFVGAIADSSFDNPQSVAVDETTGDLYVLNQGASARGILRFNADGTPHNFTDGPDAGTNILTGFSFNGAINGQVAVDNSGGSTDGTIYVTHQAFNNGRIRIYARDGDQLGELDGSTTPVGGLGGTAGIARYPTGVAVDPNGVVYVAGGSSGNVYRYVPQPAAQSVVDSDYDATLNYGPGGFGASALGLAADSSGALYAGTLGGTSASPGITKFDASQFGLAGVQTGTEVDPDGFTVYADPISDFVYTNDRSAINEYRPNGTLQNSYTASGIGDSRGVAVNGSPNGTATTTYVADQGVDDVYVFKSSIPSAAAGLIDNPVVVDSVNSASTRNTSAFQVTRDAHYAAFSSTIALTGYDNGGKSEVFRYDGEAGQLECASCNPTGARAVGNSTLASDGLSLLEDGRLFFNSTDVLAARDLNDRQDIYLWSGGVPQLLSTGASPYDSALLGASADGTDVYFFTRDSLAPQDENGPLVKIYDAREGGGFEYVPPPEPCKASDECHGPGTEAAPPAPIVTVTGTRGQFEPPAKQCNLRRLGKVARLMARRSKGLRRRANAMRRTVTKSPVARRKAKRLQRRAGRAARRARRFSGAARKCRASKQQARSNGRAGR